MNGFRTLPSVEQVLRAIATGPVRTLLEERRAALKAGVEQKDNDVTQEAASVVERYLKASLRPVINATGVILHTNLGRAPLSEFEPITGYSNLEYDLETGKRGKRDMHTSTLLEQLLGCAAIVVNNNAAAVYLVLNEMAAGGEVIISRGELIEIGDGFRIPDIMVRAGVNLREVGTTNRTSLDDYRSAINERTRLILRVHRSNFHVTGFTHQPALGELAALAAEHHVPLYEDLGSGCLVDLKSFGVEEPLVAESLTAGVSLVSFSCDKLLGGPQSGIIAGDRELVNRVRRNPMYRAFRVDKLIVQALEEILRHLLLQEWDAIPTLRMIQVDAADLYVRAKRLAEALAPLPVVVREAHSAIGGGSTPDVVLPTTVIALTHPHPASVERRLRDAALPVIARVEHGQILFDLRTVAVHEEDHLIAAIKAATASESI